MGRNFSARCVPLVIAGYLIFGSTAEAQTGADSCQKVTLLQPSLGAPGSPAETVITGNNTGGTGPDCTTPSVPVWWEAFELTECADVVIAFCGTTPNFPQFPYLIPTCPAEGVDCGSTIFRNAAGSGSPWCADSNAWLRFDQLPPGIYYIPLRADSFQGPYQIHLFASGCLGACCDLAAGTCTDGSWSQVCDGSEQVFAPAQTCCSAECLPAGQEYLSDGVELLSNVANHEIAPDAGSGNDIWGYASPSGREYAIIGFESGTGFVEVTDPFNPRVIAHLANFSPVWRDMKTYQDVAYLVNDASGGGIEVVDLSQIDDGVVTRTSFFDASGLETAHNIAVNADTAHVYPCGGNLAAGGLISVNVSDPLNPVIDGVWAEKYVHDALIISYHDGPYAGREIGFLFGSGISFHIVDLTDKANIFTMSSLSPTNFGHQGWITEDRRHIIYGREGGTPQTTFYVINVEDLENPVFLGTYSTGLCTIDHNMMIRGSFIYHANYTSGLRIFDITALPAVTNVGFFDTYPEGQQYTFAGAWGVYTGLPSGVVLVSDMNRGLFVLNYDCNNNAIDDTLDIANLTSGDCNANGLPDECEFDADDNGVPDSCDFAAMPGPQAEIGGPIKNRYLSMQIPNVTVPGDSQATAIRVTLDSLHHPPGPADAQDFTAFEGQVRWVNTLRDAQNNPIFDCPDSGAFGTSYKCAVLGCEPEYREWHSDLPGTVIHVTGNAVVPSSQYAATFLGASCAGNEDACDSVTAELALATARWGDVLPGTLNATDIAAVVDKARELVGSRYEPQMLLQPVVPDGRNRAVGAFDIAAAVDAVKGSRYPFGITPCP